MNSSNHQAKMAGLLAPKECNDPECGPVYVRLAQLIERVRIAKKSVAQLKKDIADESALDKERKCSLHCLDQNMRELRESTTREWHKASNAILANLAFLRKDAESEDED
ncbi:hypothetical protein GCK32_008768 [Trichostrongylus colubriformis]|uniref:Uncharacterized protein n=1 Tax=Trichostrongylus colubriformis TaxID=6319 RepID=A0AAN8G1B8_TRICO